MAFTHFHVHTDYSLLHSTLRVKELISKSQEFGFSSVAVTELGNMFSAIDFYQKAGELKPILGIDAYVGEYRLILIAKDYTGYENLMYLSSISYLYHYENLEIPKIPYDELVKKREGIAVIVNYLESEVGFHLNLFDQENFLSRARGYEKAKEVLEQYKNDFDDLYLEIRRDGLKEEAFIEKEVIRLSRECDVPLLAASDVWYLNREDFLYQDALVCIHDNKQFDDLHRKVIQGDRYFKSGAQMEEIFSDLPEAIENTQILDEKVTLTLDLGNPTPPKFKFTQEYAQKEGLDIDNDDDYFVYKCKEGLEERLKIIPKEAHQTYKERLDHEMKIILNMKFPGYMLIVWDFVREAENRNPHIPVGPGRGSAAGSLVAFALKITNIDPLKYGLLFERFLNPERVSMPDIDMDFCQDKRGDIIEYVRNKYGKVNVAQVITFGSLLAKGVLRDVSRVFGIDYAIADAFVKLIPDELGITLDKAKEKEPKIVQTIEDDPTYERLYQFGHRLEGIKRNTGMHAAGVVISDNELWEKTPLYRQEENYVTQYSLNYLEDVDLIKFDFLGLKTLTVIDNALKLIKKNRDHVIDFNTMEMTDPNVFKLVSSGHTLGLFQIESDGMQDLNKRLKPSNFEDLIAVLALYRPGPMESGMVDDFVDRKHGKKEIAYFFDEFTVPLKPILEPTYGVIVYQEQVMQIVQTIGGFSLGESDIIRRAMGKKKVDLMEQYNKEFSERAEKNGFTYDNASSLFSLIEKFAGYGFNKSHSAAYAMITYQTSYLKHYFAPEFMSALLSSEKENTDKIVKYIEELKRLDIEVLAPDIQKSNDDFTPEGNTVLFGLGAIKGVGSKAIESIIQTRPFADMEDFILKVDTTKVNKRVIEALIKSGAMDGFTISRKALLSQVEGIIEFKKRVEDGKHRLQNSLFGADDFEAEKLEVRNGVEFDTKELLDLEFESLGFYVSAHPLDPYKEKFEGIDYSFSSEIEELIGSAAIFVGKIAGIRYKVSKKNRRFAIVSFMDFHGTFDFMLFENDIEKLEEIDRDEPLAIKISIDKSGDFTRKSCRRLMDLEEAKSEKVDKKRKLEDITFEVSLGDNVEADLMSVYSKVQSNPGEKRVVLYLKTQFGFSLQIKTSLFCSDAALA